MVSANTLLGLALTAASALAAPAPAGPAPPTTKFLLQAKVLDQRTPVQHTDFNNLYVVAYHVAAGFDDATLQRKATKNTYFYLNGTQLLEALGTEFPATTYGTRDTYNDGWGKVTINNSGAGEGYSFFQSFSIDKDRGLIGHSQPAGSPESQNQFNGWRACDWDLNTSQLFFRVKGYDKSLPSNCANIQLKPVYFP